METIKTIFEIILFVGVVLHLFGSLGEKVNERQKIHAIVFLAAAGIFAAVVYFA